MIRMSVFWKNRLLTFLSDLFLLWILLHFGLGGLQGARLLLPFFGPLGWVLLALVVFLLLYRSDYRADLPLFVAGFALGYWGEWWGTTRGVWTYWNGAMPPDYLPPLWGLGLVTAYRLSGFWQGLLERPLSRWLSRCLAASFIILPIAGVLVSLPALARVDWSGRLDIHFFAGLLAGAALVLYRFDLRRAFPLYVCGMLLGGLYEYLGTSFGEWRYITGEQPPVWIVPLWGIACVAMNNLAELVRQPVKKGAEVLRRKISLLPLS
jgi:hypothetical protein